MCYKYSNLDPHTMNIQNITVIFLALISAIVGAMYAYLAWIPFFTIVGAKKNFKSIPRKSLLRFLIPISLVLVSILLISMSVLEGVVVNVFLIIPFVATIVTVGTTIFFFFKWKNSQDPLDVTLAQHFKAVWPDLEEFVIPKSQIEKGSTLDLYLKRIKKNPHLITEFCFKRTHTNLQDVQKIYLAYLDSQGHKYLSMPESPTEAVMTCDLQMLVFMTTDGEQKYINIVTSHPGLSLHSASSEVFGE